MFSMEPQRTDYDVNFTCLGFHVRVHPLFWLAGLILGANGVWNEKGQVDPNAAMMLLSWMSVVFVSILVHELGHSLVMRYFGQSSHIVLHMLGGLAIPDSSYGSFAPRTRITPRDHILISLAGPGAGFLLAGLTVALIFALGGEFLIDPSSFPSFYRFTMPAGTSFALIIVIHYMLFLNIFWGLVNLLPVFPLDGGQIARELFEQADHLNGFVRSLWLSIFTSVGMAIGGWVYMHDRFMPLLFLSLAASNYMTLQQITGRGPGGGRW